MLCLYLLLASAVHRLVVLVDECAVDVLVLSQVATKLVVTHKVTLVSHMICMMEALVVESCT